MNVKEHSVRNLVEQLRQDNNNQSNQQIDHLISIWSNLQKKIDLKVTFYSEIHRLHEELRGKIFFNFTSHHH